MLKDKVCSCEFIGGQWIPDESGVVKKGYILSNYQGNILSVYINELGGMELGHAEALRNGVYAGHYMSLVVDEKSGYYGDSTKEREYYRPEELNRFRERFLEITDQDMAPTIQAILGKSESDFHTFLNKNRKVPYLLLK